MQSDPVIDEAARAILEGTSPDWSGLESSADVDTRAITQQLRVLSAVAQVHRAAPSPLAAPGDPQQWGHLTLLDKVGSGAFGDVYRAWDTRLDREVALKLLPAGAESASGGSPIIEEGRLLARVRHPNVATIYGAELIDGRIGLWMEFVHGRTLEELLKSGNQFNQNDVVAIGLELCKAVSAVHSAGLLHRDIKAQNVMRADDGRVVLMDFGAGHDENAGASGSRRTAGTPLYLAPEVLLGQGATKQSDVYGVGVLLYRLLTGAYPIAAKTIDELRRAHDQGSGVALRSVRSDLPEELLQLIDRAIAPDPRQRYDNCEELAAGLEVLADAPRRAKARRRTLVAAGVVLLLGLAWNFTGRPGLTAARTGLSRGGFFGAALAPSETPVILVRPLRNLSTEPGSEVIAEGLTLELINGLAIIDGLDVKSATTSFVLKGKEIELADLGTRFGVNLVLEGSATPAGDQLRVQVQLVHVGADKPMWSGTFDRQVKDALTVQDEISREVVNKLRLTLGKGQRRYNLDQETLTLYFKGRVLAESRRREDAEAAVKIFEQVIERDRTFAPAYAGLCTAYGMMSQNLPDMLGMPERQALIRMRATAERAMELDPMLAEAHAAMGFLHSRDFDNPDHWNAAARAFKKAIEYNPGLTYIYTSYSLTTLLPMGRFDEAVTLLQEAIRRDPESLDAKRELALQLLNNGRVEDALRILEQIEKVNPKLYALNVLLARARSIAGRIDEAMPYWESVKDTVGSQQWMAYAFVRVGRRAEIERLASLPQESFRMALYQTALGNTELALDALEKSADEFPNRTARLLIYPEMASLRGHPRFEAIRARFHLK